MMNAEPERLTQGVQRNRRFGLEVVKVVTMNDRRTVIAHDITQRVRHSFLRRRPATIEPQLG